MFGGPNHDGMKAGTSLDKTLHGIARSLSSMSRNIVPLDCSSHGMDGWQEVLVTVISNIRPNLAHKSMNIRSVIPSFDTPSETTTDVENIERERKILLQNSFNGSVDGTLVHRFHILKT